MLQLPLEDHLRLAITQAMTYERAAQQHFPGFIASRRNYDIARGLDARQHLRSGVLEQSWRLGGASSAEVLALQAFADDPALLQVRASSHEVFGTAKLPADATLFTKETTVNLDNSTNMHGYATMTIQSETVELQVEDGRIAGTVVSPGSKMPAILFVHGWGGSQQRDLARARQITGLGCVCMTFDLRGHEKTESQRLTVTRQQNLEDLLAAYDRLASHPAVDPSAIALIGSSYGGYLATLLTTQRPVRWLALRVPALYWDEDWGTPSKPWTASA